MDKQKIRDLPTTDLQKGIVYFCALAGIKQSDEQELRMIARYLQEQKGSVWTDTFKQAFHNFIKGDYPAIRKPYKIDAHFISSIIEAYFKDLAGATRDPDKYKAEDEINWTPEKIERVMKDGFEWKLKAYKDNDIPIMWLFSLYDWMEKNEFFTMNDFDDNQVTERIDYVKQIAKAQRKTKRGWNITPMTKDNILKVAIVSLAMDKL